MEEELAGLLAVYKNYKKGNYTYKGIKSVEDIRKVCESGGNVVLRRELPFRYQLGYIVDLFLLFLVGFSLLFSSNGRYLLGIMGFLVLSLVLCFTLSRIHSRKKIVFGQNGFYFYNHSAFYGYLRWDRIQKIEERRPTLSLGVNIRCIPHDQPIVSFVSTDYRSKDFHVDLNNLFFPLFGEYWQVVTSQPYLTGPAPVLENLEPLEQGLLNSIPAPPAESGNWECPMCLTDNEEHVNLCVHCGFVRRDRKAEFNLEKTDSS